MTNLDPKNLPIKEQKEVVAEVKKEVSVLKMRYVKGLHVFEYNLNTEVIRRIEPIEIRVELTEKDRRYIENNGERTVLRYPFSDGCFYVQAINLTTARKKFMKMIGDAEIKRLKMMNAEKSPVIPKKKKESKKKRKNNRKK